MKELIYCSSLIVMLFLTSCDRELSVSQPDPLPVNTQILVTSKPEGYNIYLDGRISGKQVPDSLIYLEEGTHIVELKSPIFLDTLLSVELSEGERRILNIDVESNSGFYGEIECNSSPSGCLIFIDDSSTQKYTPYSFEGIYPGQHKITYHKNGYRDGITDIIVKSNLSTTIQKTLIDTTIWLVYNTNQTNIPTNYFQKLAMQFNDAGDVWGSTNNLGVIKLNDPVYTMYNKSNSDLSVFAVNDICFTYDQLYVATNEGLFIMNDSESWTRIAAEDGGLPSNSVSSLFPVFSKPYLSNPQEPGIFIGTRGKGVMIENGGEHLFLNKDNGVLPSDNITCINGVGSGVIIGTSDAGLAVSTNFNSLSFMTLNSNNSNIPSNEVYAVSLTSPNYQIWAGFDKSPINRVVGALAYFQGNIGDGSWQEIDIHEKQVFVIEQGLGAIWVGTSGGLIKIVNKQIVAWYTTENTPLTSNFVYDIVIDRSERMWLATGDGILRVKKGVL